MNTKIQELINNQIRIEAESSQFYLFLASWAEGKGYSGVANFMYTHSDEERAHMLKLIKYVNERGGKAEIPNIEIHKKEPESIPEVFATLLEHEQHVTNEISKLVHFCLEEKDYTTHNFMQWYVAEQLEEEAMAREINDKLNIIGSDKTGIYMFDRDLSSIRANADTVRNSEA